MTHQLTEKVALVTGGARGLGRAIASTFAEHGAAVALVDLDQAGTAETAQLVRSHGTRCCEIIADLTQRGAAADAVRRTVAELGRLDILVNNAGMASVQPFLDIAEDEWDKVFAVNVRGTLAMLLAAAPVMKEQGGGRIINITCVSDGAPQLYGILCQ